MRIKPLLLIISLVLSYHSFGQKSSGYLGHRTMIGVTTSLLSPALGNIFNQGDYDNFSTISDGFLKPTRFGLYIAYANDDHSMLQTSVSYQRTELMRNVPLGTIPSSRNPDMVKSLTSSAVMITAGRTFQTGGLIAPIGQYVTANLAVAFLSAEKTTLSNPAVVDLGTRFDLGLNVVIGTRRAITQRIIIDFGIEYNLYAIGILTSDMSGYEDNDELMTMVLTRSAFNNMVGVRTGVYYLL